MPASLTVPFAPNLYSVLALGGILLTAWIWGRLMRPAQRADGRLTLIYFAGLLGALLGAKLAFLIAEGWHYRQDWLALLSGRSITGGLLGGYALVELAKRWLRYSDSTGDLFALVVPLGIGLGRVGCIVEGCCPGVICSPDWYTVMDRAGVHRWPAAQLELLFNALLLAWALLAARFHWLPGNRFHIYLIAYGVFRFANEFLRDNVHWIGPLSGYHFIALAMVVFAIVRLRQRMRSSGRSAAEPAAVA